ncbi:MAG: (2Fe-2S) ferredoxin domain-containing protein [Bacillota bacterium]|nr:(2Fe-2S) ferredoxin domain-containing protein [Bacillota bacterium]
MKSLEDLEKILQEARERLRVREGSHDVRVVVGMGTCSIAAGARDVTSAFLEELARRSLRNVTVTQTGCAGLCECEPLVDVYLPGPLGMGEGGQSDGFFSFARPGLCRRRLCLVGV